MESGSSLSSVAGTLGSINKKERKKDSSDILSAQSSSPPLESTIGPVLPHTIRNRDSDIGPQMPPALALHASDSEYDEEEGETISIGPTLPKTRTQSQQESSDEDCYGPRLPSQQTKDTLSDDDDDDEYGPRLPSSMSKKQDEDSYGPTLPPALKQTSNEEEDCFGPTLPPSMLKSSKDDDDYGPKLPPTTSSKQTMDDDDDDDSYGPALPSGYRSEMKGLPLPVDQSPQDDDDDEDEDEEVVGPMPWMMHKPSDSDAGQSAVEEFEARSRAMKNKLTGQGEDKAPERDSWMTELPAYGTNFGLGARQFRKKDLPDAGDRSVWTDTPADRARKEKELTEGKGKPKKTKQPEEKTLSKRDQHLLEQVSGYNETKRGESLMDVHSRKRKQEKLDGASDSKERRPFDREVDLQVNRFDEAQKKKMMKKAAQLGDRFSHSKEKMFL